MGLPQRQERALLPVLRAIAEAAGCARSTVAEALKALEDAGVLSWVHRLKRVREPCPDLLRRRGWRWRVLRTSNAYNFRDPGAPEFFKVRFPDANSEPRFFSSLSAASGDDGPADRPEKRHLEEGPGRSAAPKPKTIGNYRSFAAARRTDERGSLRCRQGGC